MISQVISAIPAAGKRGIDTRDVFVTKQEAFQDQLYLNTVTELNTYRTQVNSTAADINDGLTAMQPVLTNLTPILAVGNSITNVNTVVTDITKVNTVSTNIANVNTTAGAITNVNNVGNNIINVNTTATNIGSVNTVAGSIANVNTVVPDIAKVNTVSASIGSVNTVSGAITNINTTATNIANVNSVGSNIANVNTIAANIANVNSVGSNIANVNTIAANITDVTYFADIYQGTKTTAPTLRNDGSALQIGDMYFYNNLGAPSQSSMMVYAVGGWVLVALSTAQVLDISSTQAVLGDKTFYDSNLKVRAPDAKVATVNLETGAVANVTITLPKAGGTLVSAASPAFTGSITEQVYNLTGTAINPANGTIQYKTVSANTTFTETLTSGQSVLLRLIGASNYTITFPTITWVGVTAPTLTANCAIVLWKEQSTLYGSFVGTLV